MIKPFCVVLGSGIHFPQLPDDVHGAVRHVYSKLAEVTEQMGLQLDAMQKMLSALLPPEPHLTDSAKQEMLPCVLDAVKNQIESAGTDGKLSLELEFAD